MNLPALYDYLANCADSEGEVHNFSWERVAQAAQVDPLEDTTAFRALIEKGAMLRIPLRNSFGDVRYVLQRHPNMDAFYAALRTVGARVPAEVRP